MQVCVGAKHTQTHQPKALVAIGPQSRNHHHHPCPHYRNPTRQQTRLHCSGVEARDPHIHVSTSLAKWSRVTARYSLPYDSGEIRISPVRPRSPLIPVKVLSVAGAKHSLRRLLQQHRAVGLQVCCALLNIFKSDKTHSSLNASSNIWVFSTLKELAEFMHAALEGSPGVSSVKNKTLK